MSSFLGDYGGLVLGLILTALPIIRDYVKSQSVRATLRSRYIWTISTLGVFSVLCGIVKIQNDAIAVSENRSKVDSLQKKVDTLRANSSALLIKVDTLQEDQSEFLRALKSGYGIGKDPSTNLPVKLNTYNTRVRDVQTLKIGENY